MKREPRAGQQREATGSFSPLGPLVYKKKRLSNFQQAQQRRAAHLTFHFMAQRSAHPVVPIALLVFGLVAILLLTVPTEDIKEAPGFMVRTVPSGIFSSVYCQRVKLWGCETEALLLRRVQQGARKVLGYTEMCGTWGFSAITTWM